MAYLPVVESNMMELVKMTPGLFTSGANAFNGPHSIQGSSDYTTGASVGGNEWSIDGVTGNGSNRNTAYLPQTDTVEEMKVETSNFDASVGQTTGASITLMTKTGAKQFHGTLTEQHWQQRWQGTNFFTRQLYFKTSQRPKQPGIMRRQATCRGRTSKPVGDPTTMRA